MPKFTFTCEHKDAFNKDVTVSKITYESNREYLGDVMEDIRDFLKGCGYMIEDEDFDSCFTINLNLDGS